MCRLLAITATDVPTNLIADVVHTIMTANAEDNTHGHGISFVDSQGQMILHKSSRAYYSGDFAWVRPYITSGVGPLIAHVRNASPGTEVSNRTAHPFGWELSSGDPFVAAHNGYFSGMINQVLPDEPKSDSHVAFRILSDVLDTLDPSEELAYRHMKSWAGKVCTYSAYATIFWFRNKLYVFRNSARTLYATRFGNGLLITTSKVVIDGVVKHMHARYGKYVKEDQPVILMPEHVLYSITMGDENRVAVERFEDFESGNDNRGGVYGRHTSTSGFRDDMWGSDYAGTTAYNQTRAQGVTTPSSTGANSQITQPLNVTQEAAIVTKSKADELREKAKVWNVTRSMLNPAREKFCLIMLRAFLKIKPSESCLWADVAIYELRRFHDFIEASSITSEMRRWLNRWNTYVDKDAEYGTYAKRFPEFFAVGAIPFLDPGFTIATMWDVLDDVLEEHGARSGAWSA